MSARILIPGMVSEHNSTSTVTNLSIRVGEDDYVGATGESGCFFHRGKLLVPEESNTPIST